jgi:hypothetical protein
MVIAFWVFIIHVVELTIVALFLLNRRNKILERTTIKQQNYIDAISIIIANSDAKLKELDTLGAFQADDEVGTFFRNLKEIQEIISDFNNS